MEKIDTIVLATKEMEGKNGKFPVYFAYRQEKTPDGTYQDVLTSMQDKEGKQVFKARPIKVRLSQDFQAKLESMKLKFPLIMKLDESKRITNREGKIIRSFYVAIDCDKERKPRLDKYGKKHLLLVIRDADDIREKPLASYSLEDLDDFE